MRAPSHCAPLRKAYLPVRWQVYIIGKLLRRVSPHCLITPARRQALLPCNFLGAFACMIGPLVGCLTTCIPTHQLYSTTLIVESACRMLGYREVGRLSGE